MQIYKAGTTTITLSGTTYQADERGIIDVPDDKINSSVWIHGFVSANGRLKELEAQKATEPVADSATKAPVIEHPAPTAEAKPVAKTDTKPTKTS